MSASWFVSELSCQRVDCQQVGLSVRSSSPIYVYSHLVNRWLFQCQDCNTRKIRAAGTNFSCLQCRWYLALSFLCTFVPGSEKYIERTFAPMELLFHGTFAPRERKVQELSFHGTFAPLELSLLSSECSKNFSSMELTFAPLELSLHTQLSCPFTFTPVAYIITVWLITALNSME